MYSRFGKNRNATSSSNKSWGTFNDDDDDDDERLNRDHRTHPSNEHNNGSYHNNTNTSKPPPQWGSSSEASTAKNSQQRPENSTSANGRSSNNNNNDDPEPNANFAFQFGSGKKERTSSKFKTENPLYENDSDEPVVEESKNTNANTSRHFTNNENYKSSWDHGFRAAQESTSSEDEDEPNTDDYNGRREFVDLTNDSEDGDDEIVGGATYQQTDHNGTDQPKDSRDQTQEATENGEQNSEPKEGKGNQDSQYNSTFGKRRQPQLDSDEDDEDNDHSSVPGSPKKRARTAYNTMKEDFFNQAPFTQTRGDFNMDAMAESIGAGTFSSSRARKRPPTTEFIDPNRKVPNFNTTSTPVNTQGPKTFKLDPDPRLQPHPQPEQKQRFQLHDDLGALELNAPVPPIMPDLHSVTEEALAQYSVMIEKYQHAWNEYNYKMNVYQQNRLNADASYGLELFKTSEALKQYMNALQLDAKVKSLWHSAYERHIRVMQEFITVKGYVERPV